METKDLEAFRAVYETGSISKASELLFISHQGLSKTIDRLETDLGVRLFERTNRGVEPTREAREVYPKAVRVLELIDSMRRGSNDQWCEPLRVACTSGGLTYNLPNFQRDFERAHQGVALRLEEGNDRHVQDLVRQGLVECGLVAGQIDHATFDSALVMSHPHVLVVGTDDPLASREFASMRDLQGRSVALIGAGFAPFDYVQDRMARQGVVPREVIGVAEISSGCRMSATDGVVTVTADFTVMPDPPEGTVVLPFDDPDFTWDISLIVRHDRGMRSDVRDLLDFARNWCREVEQRDYSWRVRWARLRAQASGGSFETD